jgi:7 transmembrane receptor (rhodopsin family)
VFTFIFFPVFVGFIWLNTIISREIWKRRHAPGHSNQSLSKSTRKTDDGDDSKDPSTLEMKNTDETNTSSLSNRTKVELAKKSPPNSSVPSSQTHTERQRRQMRMFKVILILMSVFICCRLPNWIFLFYKLKYNVSSTLNWILLYSFAALGLLNSMLNPFLYTFLNETIRITSSIANECQRFINIFCHCARYEDTPRNSNNRQMFANNVRRKSDGGIYLGS